MRGVALARTRVGTTLGDYTLTALLGLGGSAAVYSARRRDGHVCALKVMHASFKLVANELERFRREPYLANTIAHEGVVRVYDDGIDEHGVPYFVMELLEGECVGAWLGATPAPSAHAVHRVLLDTLDVLEKAHQAGILHRDIKPSNLFLCRDGRLKVLDFGIARSQSLSSLTATGAVLGTPAFMAPEQAVGDRTAYGPATDLFAVGATGLVLLHGGPLRRGNELVLAAISPLPKSATLDLDAPRSFLEVLDRAASFDRKQRYASASDMRAALLACAHELVPEAPPTRRFVTEDVHAEGFATEISGPPLDADALETVTVSRDGPASPGSGTGSGGSEDGGDPLASGERSRPFIDPLGKTRHGHG